MFVKCQICGRRLSDPVSIRMGMGPSLLGQAENENQKKNKQTKKSLKVIDVLPPNFMDL